VSAAAHLCTLLRVLLAPIFAWTIGAPLPGATPLVLYVTAVVSDVADGRLARASGRASPRGRLFDHAADVVFLLPALVVLGRAARVPFVLPCAVALAFGLYCVDGWRRGRDSRTISLVPSRSGTAAGVANYAVAGLAAIADWHRSSPLDGIVYAAALAAVAVNLAAALERVQSLLRSEASPRTIAPSAPRCAEGE